MATFRKNGNRWRAEVHKNKQRASKVLNTKAEAKEWAAEKELEFSNKSKFVSTRKRVSDIFSKYAKEHSSTKKGEKWEVVRLRMFAKLKMADLLVGDLSTEDILDWKKQRLKEVSESTVKREMNLLSTVFTTARKEWKWIKENPVSDVSRPKSPPSRTRRISQKEIDMICAQLKFNGKDVEIKKHQTAVMFLLAIETGMRLGEMHSIEIKDINFEKRFVRLSETKNDDPRDVPLSSEAIRLLNILGPELFTLTKGSVSGFFRQAVMKSGIDDLTFHDSRHEATTRLARKLDVLDLARMIGHRDLKSLMIYYNPTAEEMARRLDD